MDQESAQKNMCILKKYNYDLKAALVAQRDLPLIYGSEFKSIDVLESIFGLHPNWQRMKSILKHGSCWPLNDLPFPDRQKDLKEALEFGNHKGAESNPKTLIDLVKNDVTHG